MKILQVMAGAAHGGAETAFVDMCLAMHEAGEHIAVATRPNALRVGQLQAAGIQTHILPFGGKIDVFTPWRLQKIVETFQPNIVQTWMSRAAEKMPRWHEKMNAPRYLNVARLGSPYKMKYFSAADYFVAITPGLKTYLERNGIDPSKVRHINNFAETEEAAHKISRAAFQTPEDAPLILGLGRLHPDKAFDTLIEVVAGMPGVYVWIAGEGPQRGALEKQIASHGMQERVKLLGWRTDRAGLLQTADVCAFISRNEGFGTVFVQAWANKTPVVVCDAEGPAQYIRHREDGMMAKIDDRADIAACLRAVLDDPALARTLVDSGYQRYQAEFTKQACLQNYLAWYDEILTAEGLRAA